ncbi:MAG: DUF1887 family protein [Bacteroidales bacterium]|jgi:hypothetical protein|nr:DUF1887 family protein [Bacteroidales bacterium]
MTNLIVTLLSAQTIPNVQFIKYIRDNKCENEQTEYLFISTDAMEEKGVGDWIRKVCEITNFETICVNHSDISDIENRLAECSFDKYEQIFVNITGGTKMMSLAVSDFFKMKPNARIYYIDGKKCFLNFPVEHRISDDLVDNISLKEYVESYGFEMQEGHISGISLDYTKQFLQEFLNFGVNERRIINQLRQKRDKTVSINEMTGLQDLLCKITFPLVDKNFLIVNKYEVRYLTGDWFEEYIYFRLQEEGIIKKEDLKTGVQLKKKGIDNEFDIIFLYKTKFYAIECKTSILSDRGNIVNETIYKSTALQRNLGLFSNFSIFTLSSRESKDVKQTHLDRASDLNIKVLCREDIINSESISKLLELC